MDRKKFGFSMKTSVMVEELGYKLLKLMNKQNQSKIPSMGVNPELLNPIGTHQYEDVDFETSNSILSETISNQDILASIESIYNNTDDTSDLCRYELKKLPEVLNSKDIGKSYEKLKQQQQAVSKRALQLILQKRSQCNLEFQEILKTLHQLHDVLQMCKTSRSNLDLAKKQFTTASLGILANYKKRRTIRNLMKILQIIKTLHRTEDQLQELLKEDHFPEAISLLLECQSAAKTYRHFYCLAALAGKLQDTLDQTEETLDVKLIHLCTKFNSETYTSIQEAYKLLKKTQTAIDHLHMHFTATIHNSAFTVVRSQTDGDTKLQYKQLCQTVPRENFINCLNQLSRNLWKILSSYHQVLTWHKFDRHQESIADKTKFVDISGNDYITQKLANGLPRIWNDVEIKISIYLREANLTGFKFEQFVQILGIINRSIEIGEEMCGSKSENLQDSMKNQSFSYFSHYHTSRLEELAIFLEYEGWELCPVKRSFVATHLREFKSLKPTLLDYKTWTNNDEPSEVGNSSFNCISRYLDTRISPFHVALDRITDEDILINSRDDGLDNYNEDSEEEGIDERIREGKTTDDPIVTNTSLSILRICGRYLQMSRLLRSIVMTVIQNMIQLFEFYFYSVHTFFTSDLQDFSDSLYSPILKLTLTRIRDDLIHKKHTEDLKLVNGKIRQPVLSGSVDLGNEQKLFCLAERIVGVESIVFLTEQYNTFRSYLKHLNGNFGDTKDKVLFDQFYSQTLASAVDMRKPVYMAVIMRSIDVAEVISIMRKVNWEVRDVMSQHSEYVDAISKHIEVIKKNIEEINRSLTISEGARYALWENVAHLITHTLVEGFSNAHRCSNGGRGLMQLDFTQLKSKFEITTSLRPMPRSEYVETYIKAYYIPESALEEWVMKHGEYSVKQLTGLILCACQNNKKCRQRLISIVEQQWSARKFTTKSG